VLFWKNDSFGGAAELGKLANLVLEVKKNYNVDRFSNRFEGSFYLKVSHDLNHRRDQDIQESKQKLKNALDEIGDYEKAYVFGTGPSLEKALERDFDDGISIVCNSIVKNRKLMNHLSPKIIVFGDPIFHAGCSAYAGQFREELYGALEQFQSYVFVPFRDYALYMANMPIEHRNRIVGIPLEKLGVPNLNVSSSFRVMSTNNIITLLSLPIACTMSKKIYISGCDGRKIEDNKYFWAHHKESQINEHMETIQSCHPAFFDIDYNDYYNEHCSILEKILLHGESLGFEFHSLTESYVPALRERSIQRLSE
jgi:hypothetical protein